MFWVFTSYVIEAELFQNISALISTENLDFRDLKAVPNGVDSELIFSDTSVQRWNVQLWTALIQKI